MNGGAWPLSLFAGLHNLLERWSVCLNCCFGQGEFCGNFPFVCKCRDTIRPVCVSICCKLLVEIHHLGMLDYKCVNIPWLQNQVIFIPHFFFLFFSFLEDLVTYWHIILLADTWPELGCRLEPTILTSCNQAFWENKVFRWILDTKIVDALDGIYGGIHSIDILVYCKDGWLKLEVIVAQHTLMLCANLGLNVYF